MGSVNGKYLSHVDIIVEDATSAKGFFSSNFDWQEKQAIAGREYTYFNTQSRIGFDDELIGIWGQADDVGLRGSVPFYWVDDVATFLNGLPSTATVLKGPATHPRQDLLYGIFKWHNGQNEEAVIGVIQIPTKEPTS